MAKYALLIGVSEYQSSEINSLPGVLKDIEAMQRVLQQPDIGGFDDVQLLTNPDTTTIQSAIQHLFIERCQKNDLALLYFSGHGWRDENRCLYFISQNSIVNSQNQVLNAVSARFIQEECMNRSKTKRQVLILDSCYSGAFAEGMSAKEITAKTVDIEAQLGGEGRAILTSSTAVQVSFEDEIGGGIYTRHLVEGIEKGAADTDKNGIITVAELHEYAKRKVQEAKPAMKPEIYAVREGYTINLAKAPIGNKELEYRQEVDFCIKNGAFLIDTNNFKRLARKGLDLKQKDFKLSSERAKAIEEEALQAVREFQLSLQEYEQTLSEELNDGYVISQGDWEILKSIQKSLKLRDEDVAAIYEKLNVTSKNSSFPASIEASTDTKAKELEDKIDDINNNDDLASEKGIDYTQLRDLLKAQNWQKADEETATLMLQVANREEEGWLDVKSINNFPCADLRTIDQLWVKYSNGRFGFSVQKRIYQSLGGTEKHLEIWNAFGDRVGWKKEGSGWMMYYSDITFSLEAPEAHLPMWFGGGRWAVVGHCGDGMFLFSRIQTCKM
jgi:GUN4-like/Caspase domain